MATTTVYPDPSVESTSVDGIAGKDGATSSWTDLRGAVGDVGTDNGASLQVFAIATTTTDVWSRLYRNAVLFDTSGIDDGDTVSAATLSIYPTAKDASTITVTLNVSASNPDVNTVIDADDYTTSKWGSVKFATGVTVADISTGAYHVFTLNASGIAAVDVTGISKFGIRYEEDIDGNTGPAWASGGEPAVTFSSADTANTTQDPKLVVTHAVASATFVPTMQIIM